ncbi:class I SAM-dependent methyltransferase [Methylacidiphilales bacterium]|nr:class I SAM-dependent methyltransferase [Candidatus Methylacidiphilales bacterium]
MLPPGTLLQLMYLQDRLKQLSPGRFIEIGPGSGETTNLLLKLGWTGYAFDLEAKTIQALGERFHDAEIARRLVPIHANFLTSPPPEKVDLVISCMVMEHMEDEQELAFMHQAARCLNQNGLMIGLVPASPAHWGIEDDIAGHYRRYTREALKGLMQKSDWKLTHTAGLTFPVSNLLFPISNYLVRRAEKYKLTLSHLEKTKLSGRRQVKFKTHFPSLAGILLNKPVLTPLHWLQKKCSKSEHALVIYFEAKINFPVDRL